MTKFEKELETLNPFEIAEKLREASPKDKAIYDAGRGNPNWINTTSRKAFAKILNFGCMENPIYGDAGMSLIPENKGIAEEFERYLRAENGEAEAFLLQVLDFAKSENWTMDDFVAELVHGTLGDNYPVPSRILKYCERVQNRFFEDILYGNRSLERESQIFATEGGSAAICYIFNSLKENFLIRSYDKIAINTPIFPPYLDIPVLNDYELVEVDIESSPQNNWQIDVDELDKLKNPEIKVFFLVNPSNPSAMALSTEVLDKLEEVVAENPGLMIVTDDVYATFVPGFESIYARCPKNTVLVYSFSKLYGATGWRVGDVIINKNNIFDEKIAELPAVQKEILKNRYAKVSTDVENFSFIERIMADSRAIGLAHTAGVATPAQIMQMLFSFVHILDDENKYEKASNALVKKRATAFYEVLGYHKFEYPLYTYYYGLVNIYRLARKRHNEAFATFLEENYEEINFSVRLTERFGIMLLRGLGFGTQAGELRISFSNLNSYEFPIVAQAILDVMDSYYDEFLKQ